MEIFVQVVEGDKQSTLQMNHASQSNEEAVINGFFGLFGVKAEAKQGHKSKKETQQTVTSHTVPRHVALKVSAESPRSDAKTESLNSRAKKLPLLGTENRAAHPISEVARIKPLEKQTVGTEDPEHWRTGIKIDEDGTKRYKCRYWCSCGNKGNHYILLNAEYTNCHECNKEIPVETATFEVNKEGIPERDEYGNFFIARA